MEAPLGIEANHHGDGSDGKGGNPFPCTKMRRKSTADCCHSQSHLLTRCVRLVSEDLGKRRKGQLSAH